MYLEIQQDIRGKFVQAVEEAFSLQIAEPMLGFPPSVDLGEISVTSCFELARQLRQPPRKIAEQVAGRLLPIPGVERVSSAGAGYLNFHLDRAALAVALFRLRTTEEGPAVSPETVAASPSLKQLKQRAIQDSRSQTKILVEHTSINPNKAAHIGHLRNAILGDTFARLLRFRSSPVEVQNYIDNTGVQVADVIVGFTRLEKRSVDDVRGLIQDPSVRFDYYCWDLYARVFQFYEDNPDSLTWRAEALKAIEEGHNMTDPLRESEIFPNMVVQMIGVGEQTGAMDAMLQKIADFYEDEVDSAVKDMLTLMEPMIIAFLGVAVGGVVISLYLPLFSLIGKLAG